MQNNCEISYNTAFGNGGGIWTDDVSLFYLNGVTFKQNQASNNGGAIYVNNGPASSMQFDNCLFIDNIAQTNGLCVHTTIFLYCFVCFSFLFFGAHKLNVSYFFFSGVFFH